MKSNDPRLAELLTICNQQRVKTLDEFMREIIATANPEDAYQALIEHRAERAETNHNLERIQLRDYKARDKISAAKRPMLDAVRRILEENREYWPLSDRQIITGYFLFPSCGTLPNPTACIAIPCSVTRM